MFKDLLKSKSLKLLFHKWILITTIAVVIFVPLMVYFLGALGEDAGIDLYISKLLQSFDRFLFYCPSSYVLCFGAF